MTVHFGDIPAVSYKVLDAETLEVIAPAGPIGTVDVRVQLNNGQQGTLTQAFTYQQPPQSQIRDKGRIYDMALDPSGSLLFAAQGETGVLVYDLNAGNYSADPQKPLNPDDLLRLIDRNGDKSDDRIISRISLPAGFIAVGVEPYFERGSDRVYITAVRLGSGGTPDAARLFTVAFDELDPAKTTLIGTLELPGNAVRGLRVRNARVLLAMGSEGLGIVDSFLPNKTYLVQNLAAAANVPMLDIATQAGDAGTAGLIVAVGGTFDYRSNRLQTKEEIGSGGFQVYSQSANQGLQRLGQLDLPGTRVSLQGRYAYVAAGASGVAVVDLLDPSAPSVVARVNDIGYVYDLDFNGNTLYVARGDKGVLMIDVTNPLKPVAGRSMTSSGSVESVVAGDYSAHSGGVDAQGSLLQVVPDVLLKLIGVDPANSIVDRQVDGSVQVIARFNKAIDLYPANNALVQLLDAQGQALPATVTIVNNDAKLVVAPATADRLPVGERLTLLAKAGIASVKPVSANDTVVLQRLAQDQRVALTFRGARNDTLSIEAVTPRRVARDTVSLITVSALGLPANLGQVRLYAGDRALQIEGVTRDNSSAPAILKVSVPALPRAGQYNLTLQVQRDGLWQQTVLEGALLVDAPIRFDALVPLWGPVAGDSTVTISGDGFEPGNTVMDGLKVRFGGLPVGRIDVLASNRMRVTSPRGAPGKVDVLGEDRYGNQASLTGLRGFGYGLRKQSELHPSLIFPSDVWIDQQTGVAITNGGHMVNGYGRQTLAAGGWLPELYRAASFSVQDASKPVLVGGASSLPSDNTRLSLKAQANAIYKRMEGANAIEPSEEEQEILDRQAAQDFKVGFDSLRISPTVEWEQNTWRKRLYVASGTGGVARLNLDEQNGLQVIQDEALDQPVSRLIKQGPGLFAAMASVDAEPPDAQTCAFKMGPSSGSGLAALNYQNGEDPVRLAAPAGLSGGALLQLNDGWLFSGGNIRSAAWVNCPGWDESLNVPSDLSSGEIRALNLFDPAQTRSYSFVANPQDIVSYGRYLIAAVGSRGVEIINRDEPDERVVLGLDGQLQASPGRGVRLRLAGSLLFVAADSGVVVVDLSEPLQPRVVSAGNAERIEALDLFNNRLVAGSGTAGLTLLELPGALVLDASVKQGGVLPAGEQALQLTFNEPVTLESLRTAGSLRLLDVSNGEQALNAPTIEALNGDGQSASRVVLRFTPTPGAQLRLRLEQARNLRGAGLWSPYQVDFKVAPSGATQPAIKYLENASFHRGAQDRVVIHGSGFSSTVKGFINQYPIELQWVSAERLEIAPHALDLLPLSPGQWHLRLDDGGLRTDYLGALVVGAEQALEQVKYSISPDSASKKGGAKVTITAAQEVLMPGTKVVLRARHGDTEIYTGRSPIVEEPGNVSINLHDNVETQRAFSFVLPGVIDPDIYDVFLRIPSGAATREIKVGSLSYTLPQGLGILLPNYPPMQIGAAQVVGDRLFVGVKAGAQPTSSNRFLMTAGLEIYDIGLWERPIRLSQLRLTEPVLGLEVLDSLVYLANDHDGVRVVDANDLSKPLDPA